MFLCLPCSFSFQFLDCAYQLVRQFPHYFEYSPRYLLLLADHVYSCRFGTFLGNSDAERVSGRVCCLEVAAAV